MWENAIHLDLINNYILKANNNIKMSHRSAVNYVVLSKEYLNENKYDREFSTI